MKKNKWFILFSTLLLLLLLCVGVIGPGPVLAGDPPPLAGRDTAPGRKSSRAPSQPTAACTVPSSGYATIAAALLDPTCDPIIVSAGSYPENLVVERPVTIQGDDADTTIVDGGGINAVFMITNTASVTLAGLTIQNGTGFLDPVYGPSGGGVCNWNGNVTITDSIIYSNTADWGGGVYNLGTTHIENTDVMTNSAWGGGAVYNGAEIVLVNSALVYNIAWNGGGLQTQRNATISNTLVAANWASNRGGGVFNFGGTALIDDSLIGYNIA